MTDKLLTRFKTRIHGLTLVPSTGGCFELTVNGELIHSKLKTGRFPDEEAVAEAVAAKLNL